MCPNYVTGWRLFLATDSLPERPPMHYNPDERHDTGPTDEEIQGEVDLHEQVEFFRALRERDRLYQSGASNRDMKAAGEVVEARRAALTRRSA